MSYPNQARMFFDLETAANADALALMLDPKPSKTLKDPAKIANDIEEKRKELIESAALDPDYGKVLSLGYMINGPLEVLIVGDVKAKTLISRDPETGMEVWDTEYISEVDILNFFWDRFKFCGGACVGYNILGFDLPYLLRRSMALGVKVPFIPNLAKFRTDPVTDLMAILYNWDSYKAKSLKQVAKLYGIPVDCPDVDGSMVKNMKPEELYAYQASDVKLVMALHKRMNGVYFNHL